MLYVPGSKPEESSFEHRKTNIVTSFVTVKRASTLLPSPLAGEGQGEGKQEK
jgi:hypothetical protein